MIEKSADDDSAAYPDVVKTADAGEPASVAVVEAVVEASERPVADLGPLADTVDTDALDALFASRRNGDGRRGEFSFDYEGFRVTVLYDGGVDVLLERHE